MSHDSQFGQRLETCSYLERTRDSTPAFERCRKEPLGSRLSDFRWTYRPSCVLWRICDRSAKQGRDPCFLCHTFPSRIGTQFRSDISCPKVALMPIISIVHG
ncbi:hypothetical protein TNCV_3110191 [Trichonephila clavipes]|nr:hypothetical protein TNCV_3110191 [Trichonephila clavipes]